MSALHYLGPKHLEWQEAPPAELASDASAVVRPIAVATCDLDSLIISGRAPFPPPFVLGHEGVAEVLAVGDRVTSLQIGDLVVVPFQINCGLCPACTAGRTASCTTVPFAQTYGFGVGVEATEWGGFLSDAVVVPYADAMLMALPSGVAPEVAASASDNITDAFRAVGPPLTVHPAAPVLVVGGGAAGSIGLYSVALAFALGAESVTYVDSDAQRGHIAARYGATVIDHTPERLDSRFPIVVDAAATRDGLALALASVDRDGICTSTAVYLDPATIPPFPLLAMYMFNTTFVTGRAHARRDAPKVLDLLATEAVDVRPVISRTVPFSDAREALLEPHTKLIFTRDRLHVTPDRKAA